MKVAVIIPCYNVARHVGAAIRSVRAQTHPELEIVAVDDGSTDGTLEELHRHLGVRVLEQAHLGACAARNRGLRESTGAYVQFLDADDVLEEDKIAGQLRCIAGAAPAIVAGRYRNRFGTGPDTESASPHDPWMALVRGQLGTTSANLWQRAAVEMAGGWNEKLASSQDHELAFRLMSAGGAVVFDDRIGATILKRTEGSISRKDPVGNWERYIDLRIAMRDHLIGQDREAFARPIHVAEQLVFGAIRIIAKHDPERGLALFNAHLGRSFVPEVEGAITERYLRIYRLVGFRVAERAARAMDTLQRLTGGR